MKPQSLAGTELVKVMLMSLNVNDQCIKPQNRFEEDMGLSLRDVARLYTMVESCFRIQLDDTVITCLDDLLVRVSSSDFVVEAIS